MSKKDLKQIKKGSVGKFREFYNNIVKKPLSSDEREELKDIFKKKEKATPEKKIAKPAKSEAER